MDTLELGILTVIGGLVVGYGIFWVIIKCVPYLERKENFSQKREVLKEAQRQRQHILEQAMQAAQENIALASEELEASLKEITENCEIVEEELNAQESFLEAENQRVEKLEERIAQKQAEVAAAEESFKNITQKCENQRIELIRALEGASHLEAPRIQTSLVESKVEERRLECQKHLKFLAEEMDLSAIKQAQRIMERVHARYAPEFVWPKGSNIVELTKESLAVDTMKPFVDSLAEETGVSIQIVDTDHERPYIKVAGGYGIYREAAKLALSEVVAQSPSVQSWQKVLRDCYNRQRGMLENEAAILGRRAITELRLNGIHPEIQKLVGALNWRTSYRQNQWYHTVEVAVLAGLLASELGVDIDAAKRVGLLHDIGKAIDYRIEGSHAVISGDYADRFGERRVICDTVMSHHADLLVETPLAYVLRAADTLSGARPGARVNLEEGYQIRLDAILEAIHSFPAVQDVAIMNGGREVHIQVNNAKIKEEEVKGLTEAIVKKIEETVSFPGQIKVMVSRSFEAVSVA